MSQVTTPLLEKYGHIVDQEGNVLFREWVFGMKTQDCRELLEGLAIAHQITTPEQLDSGEHIVEWEG